MLPMSHEKPTLKPVPAFPAFDHKGFHEPIFAAATMEPAGKELEEYDPREPLHWWYRPERKEGMGTHVEGSWREIPPDALLELGHNLRVVKVLTDQLDLPHQTACVAL